MESSKGESEKSQSIKLNVILSVPPLFYILYPPLEPFCHPPPFRQKGAFLSYRKLCFHTIKKLRLGCALGAGVDGCRSNRASARECALAHSFMNQCVKSIKKPDQVSRKGHTNQIGKGVLDNSFSSRALLLRLNSPHKPLQKNGALRVLLPLHAGKMLWFLLQ